MGIRKVIEESGPFTLLQLFVHASIRLLRQSLPTKCSHWDYVLLFSPGSVSKWLVYGKGQCSQHGSTRAFAHMRSTFVAAVRHRLETWDPVAALHGSPPT